ncbi:MAG: restriction endonuclease [Lachnospiraceae bacterium]|nr:restriction endonuclease [Lachnospiraceae bacterium]
MSVEVLPSGHYRARVMIKGKLYGKVFDKKEDALLWEKMVKARKGIGFSDNDIDFKDKKSVFYHISKQINSKNKGKNMRVLEELAEIDEMSGNAFEEYCISLFELSGLLKYARYSVTRKSGDYGADIIIEIPIYICVSVKTNRNSTRKDKLMKHCGTQKLETDRLVLRRYVNEDAAAMYNNWAADEEVTRFLMWPAHSRGCQVKCVSSFFRPFPQLSAV